MSPHFIENSPICAQNRGLFIEKENRKINKSLIWRGDLLSNFPKYEES